jgi:predicted O-methyltransferase YrrM
MTTACTATVDPQVAPETEASADPRSFASRLIENYNACTWQPHPRFSVFTQWDQQFYLSHKPDFMHKYRCFYAVSRTIRPRKLIELGSYAGSSADAYLSACPDADYLGIDLFGTRVRQDDGSISDPRAVAEALLHDRGFPSWRLLSADLRSLDRLPEQADLVVVDAAHDYDNEYADLQLALTANPRFIFVDDATDAAQGMPAIQDFLNHDLQDRVRFTVGIDYIGGGLVIALDDSR